MARRTRLRLLVVFGLASLAWLLLLRVPNLSARQLERTLSSFFHREVTVREVRWRAWPLEVEVLGVRVAGDKPGAPAFLEVPRILAAPVLQPLWLRRIVLARLRIEAPRFRIHAYADGGDDIPKLGGAGQGFELRVRRLVIEDGEFQLDHRRVPLTVDLPDFRGRLSARSAGALAGSVSFGPGRLRFGDNPELGLATEMEMRLTGPLLTVETGRLHAPKIDLTYDGQLHLGPRPVGEFSVEGPVDLEQLDRHVMRTGFGIQGQARFAGRVWLDGSRLRLRGALEGGAGMFDGVAVPRFKGQLAWDDAGVHLRGMDVEALGGRGLLDVEVHRERAWPSSTRRSARRTRRRRCAGSSSSGRSASAPPRRATSRCPGHAGDSARSCRAASAWSWGRRPTGARRSGAASTGGPSAACNSSRARSCSRRRAARVSPAASSGTTRPSWPSTRRRATWR
jgi:hypothetical protein